MKRLVSCAVIFLSVFIFCSSNIWAEVTEQQAADAAKQAEPAVTESPAEAVPPAPVTEAAPQPKEDVLTKADALLEKGGLENCKQALDLCLKEAEKNPNDYKANWMTARAYREVGYETKISEEKGWEAVCKEYGKKGMGYADKAVKLDPKRCEGYYYYGLNVGIYSDGVSILTALKEGLKDKTQTSFETAYKIDKTYDKGGVIVALGRFWQVLPWPLSDKDKSMEYYREFQKAKFAKTKKTAEFNVYFSELLMEDSKTKDEAKSLLEEVPKLTNVTYWQKKAKTLLDKI